MVGCHNATQLQRTDLIQQLTEHARRLDPVLDSTNEVSAPVRCLENISTQRKSEGFRASAQQRLPVRTSQCSKFGLKVVSEDCEPVLALCFGEVIRLSTSEPDEDSINSRMLFSVIGVSGISVEYQVGSNRKASEDYVDTVEIALASRWNDRYTATVKVNAASAGKPFDHRAVLIAFYQYDRPSEEPFGDL